MAIFFKWSKMTRISKNREKLMITFFYGRSVHGCILARSGSELLDSRIVTHVRYRLAIVTQCICAFAWVLPRSGSELLHPINVTQYELQVSHRYTVRISEPIFSMFWRYWSPFETILEMKILTIFFC